MGDIRRVAFHLLASGRHCPNAELQLGQQAQDALE
jgi:hypothetical protein